MKTRQKQVIHIKQNDQVVLTSEVSGKETVWPVVEVKPHDILESHTQLSFGYEAQEPDGKGGWKIVTLKTSVTYQNNTNLQVVKAA